MDVTNKSLSLEQQLAVEPGTGTTYVGSAVTFSINGVTGVGRNCRYW